MFFAQQLSLRDPQVGVENAHRQIGHYIQVLPQLFDYKAISLKRLKVWLEIFLRKKNFAQRSAA